MATPRAQGGVSQYGDAGSYFASILAGKNFAEGRGNIAVNVEYARQNSLYASQRRDLRTVNNFVTTDTDPAGIAAGQLCRGAGQSHERGYQARAGTGDGAVPGGVTR